MYLIYLDESGNSGQNLNDSEQPIFCLCAMIVAEDNWQGLESDLAAVLDGRFENWREIDRFEIHGSDLRRGMGIFAGISVEDRIAFRDRWMNVALQHGVKLVCRTVHKKLFSEWCVKELGSGIKVNPHVVAFAMLARCIDDYLYTLPGVARGIFISDENKEVVGDIEKSIKTLRGLAGSLRLGRILEKGFFIDSTKSLPLQLCDLFALSLRKREERLRGFAPKSFDDSGIAIAERLSYAARENDVDALDWLKDEQKKKRPGDKPRVD